MASALGRVFGTLLFTLTGSYVIAGQLLVGTSATAIPLGSVTQPRWCAMRNMDSTNYVRIHNGSGGAKVIKLLGGAVGTPAGGDPCIFPWDDTATPYATANTAACVLDYLIISV